MANTEKPKNEDWMSAMMTREKKPSPVGTSFLIGLTAADVILQYGILKQGWGQRLVSALGGTAASLVTARSSSQEFLGLAPYPALVFGLAAVGSASHIVWALTLKEYELTPLAAFTVASMELGVNTANTLFACWALTSQAPSDASSTSVIELLKGSPALLVGTGAFVLGIGLQMTAEFQRKFFKRNPENKGKPYGGGLWSLATHINYGAFTIWRAGYALCSGGATLAAVTFCAFFYDFANRAIPSLDDYCVSKYGKAYEDILETTTYKFLPLLY